MTQPIIANSNTLADPTKAASIFFAACRAKDLDVLKKVISERQQASLKKFGDTLEMFAEAWAKNNIVSIDGSNPPTKTAGGRTITEVNVTIATDSGNRPAKVTFALEESGWKMDEN